MNKPTLRPSGKQSASRAEPRVDLLTKHQFVLRLVLDRRLSPASMRIGAYLVERFNDDPACDHPGSAWPGYTKIAEATGYERSCVKGALKELKAFMYFVVKPGDRNTTNQYVPLWGGGENNPRVEIYPRVKSNPTGRVKNAPRGRVKNPPVFHSDIPSRYSTQREPARSGGKASSKRSEAARRAALEAYEPSPAIVAWASESCAAVDNPCGQHHVEKFRNWHLEHEKYPRNLDAAFKTWLLREQEYAVKANKSERGSRRRSGASLLELQLQRVKDGEKQ